jgi:hypothetical protein
MSCQGECFDRPRGYGDDTVRLAQLVRDGESVIDRALLRAPIRCVHRSDAERLASKPRILNASRKVQRLKRPRLCDSGDTIPLLCTDVHVPDVVVAMRSAASRIAAHLRQARVNDSGLSGVFCLNALQPIQRKAPSTRCTADTISAGSSRGIV